MLLVGHGTRSAEGRRAFLLLAERIRQRLSLPVEPCFLELAEPTIAQGVARLVKARIDRLVVAPQLLFAAGHAKQDVPVAVAAALSQSGAADIPTGQTTHFGCHPLIVELGLQRLREAVADRDPLPPNETLLIVVGRGSRDAGATSEMHQFARLLSQHAGMPRIEAAFLAMAQPSASQVLEAARGKSVRRVIVHPHLLFAGELTESLHKLVARSSLEQPDQEWIMSRVLADELEEEGNGTELLIAAAVDLIRRCLP